VSAELAVTLILAAGALFELLLIECRPQASGPEKGGP